MRHKPTLDTKIEALGGIDVWKIPGMDRLREVPAPRPILCTSCLAPPPCSRGWSMQNRRSPAPNIVRKRLSAGAQAFVIDLIYSFFPLVLMDDSPYLPWNLCAPPAQPAREQPRVCSVRVASFPGPGLCLARVDGGTAGTEGSEPKPRNSYSQDLITFLDPSKNGGHHRTATLRLEVRPGCRCELRTVRTSPPRRARATHTFAEQVMRAIVDPEREVELGESCYYCVVRYGTVDCKASNRDAPTEEVITGTPTVATAPYFSSKVRRGPAWQLRMGRAMRLTRRGGDQVVFECPQMRTTSVRSQTRVPAWGAAFEFAIEDPSADWLCVDVFRLRAQGEGCDTCVLRHLVSLADLLDSRLVRPAPPRCPPRAARPARRGPGGSRTPGLVKARTGQSAPRPWSCSSSRWQITRDILPQRLDLFHTPEVRPTVAVRGETLPGSMGAFSRRRSYAPGPGAGKVEVVFGVKTSAWTPSLATHREIKGRTLAGAAPQRDGGGTIAVCLASATMLPRWDSGARLRLSPRALGPAAPFRPR